MGGFSIFRLLIRTVRKRTVLAALALFGACLVAPPTSYAGGEDLTARFLAYQQKCRDAGLICKDQADYASSPEAANAADTELNARIAAMPTRTDKIEVLNSNNQYEKEALEMEGEMINGHSFNKSAQNGMRGAGHLAAAGGVKVGEELKDTSNALNVTGKAAQLSTYAGYATSVASIGAAAMTYMERKNGGSETAKQINDIAAKSSIGIGTVNIAAGTYGYFRAREYETDGVQEIDRLEKALVDNPQNAQARRNLIEARKRFVTARKDANEAAVGMLVRGAGNLVVGGGALYVNEKLLKEQSSMKSLDATSSGTATTADARTSATGTANTSTATTSGTTSTSTGAPYNSGVLSSSNGTATPAAPGQRNATIDANNPSVLKLGTNGLVPSSNGVNAGARPSTGGVVAAGGGSIDPNSARGRELAALQGGGYGGGASSAPGIAGGMSGGGGGTNGEAEGEGGEEGKADDMPAPSPSVSDATTYSGGGGAIRLAGEGSEDANPLSGMFGQLGQMIGDAKGGAPSTGGGRVLMSSPGNASESATQNVVLGQENNIFQSHRQKMFLMKFRGNL